MKSEAQTAPGVVKSRFFLVNGTAVRAYYLLLCVNGTAVRAYYLLFLVNGTAVRAYYLLLC